MVTKLCSSVLCSFILISFCLGDEINPQDVVFAEVKSCKGCQLRGLPEVKAFIFDDIPLYGDNVTFMPVQGAPPELILYDKDKKEIKKIPLRDYTRSGCNELLKQYGFTKEKKSEL